MNEKWIDAKSCNMSGIYMIDGYGKIVMNQNTGYILKNLLKISGYRVEYMSDKVIIKRREIIMEKIKNKVKNFMIGCRQTFTTGKNKVMLGLMTLSYMLYCPIVAYADVQGTINTVVTKGIDWVFNLTGGGFVISGVFALIMAIYKFIGASQARDGEQQRDAGNSIGIALMILALGAAVFILKSPISDLIKELMISN